MPRLCDTLFANFQKNCIFDWKRGNMDTYIFVYFTFLDFTPYLLALYGHTVIAHQLMV